MFQMKNNRKRKRIESIVTGLGAFSFLGSCLCIYAALFLPWEIVQDWLYLFMVVLAFCGFIMAMLEQN